MVSSVFWRKSLTAILVIAVSFGLFFVHVEKSKAYSNLDQHITEADGYFRIQTHQKLGQSFRPTYNKLDGLGVYSGIQPAGPSSCALTVSLYKNTDLTTPLASKTVQIYKMEAYTIIDIPTVDMIPNDRYTMYASASSPYAYWLSKMSDVYPRGMAIIDSVSDGDVDMVFATFGYTGTPPAAPDPVPTVTVSETSTGGDAGTASTSTTDSTSTSTESTTSASISAPTSLTATAATEGTASSINLAWKASSTSDITGYRIYRSVSETTAFAELETVDKAVLTFSDSTAVANQPYYYHVRAYKGTSQSSKSNVATATITDKTAPAKPANFKISSSNESEIVFGWDANADTDMANYVLTVAENANADAKVLAVIENIGKGDVAYTLKLADNAGLVIDTNYTFYLQAKDVNNNLSEKASVEGMFAKAKEKSNLWTWIGLGAAFVLLAGLVTLLIIRRRKNKATI